MSAATDRIRTSHGEAVTINGMPTGQLYGSGYGQDAECSAAADRAAELLAAAFPQWAIVKRGNSSGKDAGAFIDLRGPDWSGSQSIGIGARRTDTGGIRIDALFPARYDNAAVLDDFPKLKGSHYWDKEYRDRAKSYGITISPYGMVFRPGFATLEDARDWLTKWTAKHLPAELTTPKEDTPK